MERRLGDHKALPLFDRAKLSRVHEHTFKRTPPLTPAAAACSRVGWAAVTDTDCLIPC
jgi:hypothetical protein